MKNIFTTLILAFVFHNVNAQKIDESFFRQADSFFKENVKEGLVNYMDLKASDDLSTLINVIETQDFKELNKETKKAYLINAYNLLVINEAVKAYPIGSVQDIAGFFDRKKVTIAGTQSTLTDFEKKEILDQFEDPRLHFVLVCGALGCPPITDFAYEPQNVERQIEDQTTKALNNPSFIHIIEERIQLSQIFKWYASDFGTSKSSIISFINKYRDEKFESNASVDYYNYDWTLNAASTSSGSNPEALNANRYIVSSTIPKGQIELKIFNNLYSQVVNDGRSSFFTTSVNALYGLNKRFNIGVATRYRRVLNSGIPSSPFDALTNTLSGQFRQGLTAIGPQIRWAPKPKWQNFSIQSSLTFPVGNDLSGTNDQQWIDWQGPSFINQFFNDVAIGNRFSLFTEVGLHWEDIGLLSNGRINQVSTPLTAILSFNPTKKSIIYALGGFTPYYRIPFDYFIQGGLGGKYQFTRNVEIELLYTGFTNTFLLNNDGGAATYNVGFRFNI